MTLIRLVIWTRGISSVSWSKYMYSLRGNFHLKEIEVHLYFIQKLFCVSKTSVKQLFEKLQNRVERRFQDIQYAVQCTLACTSCVYLKKCYNSFLLPPFNFRSHSLELKKINLVFSRILFERIMTGSRTLEICNERWVACKLVYVGRRTFFNNKFWRF